MSHGLTFIFHDLTARYVRIWVLQKILFQWLSRVWANDLYI